MTRQRPHRRQLNRDRLMARRILAGDRLGKKGLVASEIGEIARAAQRQRLLECPLQMAVRGFDRAVLVRDPGIVARRLDPVMLAEGLVALGLVFLGREIAVGRRQPVGAVLLGNPAELPQRFLQTFGQRREALAAADRLDILPTAVGQPEMVKQMTERLAGDPDAETAAIGKIRQGLPAGRMLLPKDQLALGALGRSPVRDTALQRAQ
jgi:hypothetical protein